MQQKNQKIEDAPNVLKNTAKVGLFTTISRVLGVVREMLQSSLIGAGWEQSAFTLAFAIPNMARKLFGEGALTSAFIPVFKDVLKNEGEEAARKVARSVMSMALLMLGSLTVLSVLGVSAAFSWYPWGLEVNSEQSERVLLILKLTRTLLPYMIFICGAAFGMGIMNALGRFFAAAALPCILNIIWILSLFVLLFVGDMAISQRVQYVAIAILISGACQMGLMFWCMHKRRMSPKITFKGWRNPHVSLIWRNTAIGAIGAGAIQINYMLDQLLAQWAAPWAAGVIGYADRLMDMPLGIIGVSFGTVLLPTLSGFFSKKDVEGARGVLVSSTQKMLFLILPAAAGLAVLAPDITRVIYEGNAFDGIATIRVSRATACYSIGLGFFGLQKCIVPWFHAQKDMKTPLYVSMAMVFFNAILNVTSVLLLPVEWRHVGLAGSTVVCSLITCILLAAIARRRNGALGFKKIVKPVLQILLASAVMCFAIYYMRDFLNEICSAHQWSGVAKNITTLSVLAAVGAGVYFAVMFLFKKISSRLK
ncbi:MAG: murein biosynthesis integral membrane protein MurJ [Kiritimatiellae bacterium]|nr:murein biosynthesis integral membrane protein MurJ [Kiritimatiellia bacterium]